jgi:hypothetical protein
MIMDDERRRQVIEQAYDTLDRLQQREQERALEKWQRGPVDDGDDREDALLRWQRLRLRSVEPSKREPPEPPQRRVTTMDPETESAWNRWVKAHIDKALTNLATIVGEEMGTNERKLREEMESKIAALQTQISKLQEHRGPINDDEPIDLPDLREWRSHVQQ